MLRTRVSREPAETPMLGRAAWALWRSSVARCSTVSWICAAAASSRPHCRNGANAPPPWDLLRSHIFRTRNVFSFDKTSRAELWY